MDAMDIFDIPVIFDEICRFLSISDLMTCRCLNQYWNASVVKILKERNEGNGPFIKITNAYTNERSVAAHLRFLIDRKFKSIDWFRTYKLEVYMDGARNVSMQHVPPFIGHCVKLAKDHGQRIVSMDLKYQDMSDVLLVEVFNDSNFQLLFDELTEIRFAIARLHHCSEEDPQYLIRTINSIPNLTKLTLCYTRMFQQFMAEDPCDFYCMAISGMDRVAQLEQLTISLNYLSFCFINNWNELSSLKLLRIFIQDKADFNRELFEFLRTKCPSLKELYLIRMGSLASWWAHPAQDLPDDDDADWLENLRQMESEFTNIRIVVEKRF